MALEKEKYVNQSTEQLQNRKKVASVLIVILIVAILIDAIALIYNLAIGEGFITTLFVPAAACFVVFIPIYIGKKKIEEEIRNRKAN